MYNDFQQFLASELQGIQEAGLYKTERLIESPQGADIIVNGKHLLNFCANNYLGLAMASILFLSYTDESLYNRFLLPTSLA